MPVIQLEGSPLISLPVPDPGLRRVSVHAGPDVTDLVLPAGVPVAVLVPSIVDVLDAHDLDNAGEARRYQLSCPGAAPLCASTTLAQNDIRDGAVLVLSQAATPSPAPSYDDVAEAVSATLAAGLRPDSHIRRRRATRLTGAVAASCVTGIGALALVRDASGAGATHIAVAVAASAGFVALLGAAVAHRTYGDALAGLALSVIATAFAAVAGVLAVPGGPGLSNVVLAATAAFVTSVLAMRLSGCGAVTLTALSCVAAMVAAAAAAGVMTAAPLRAIGSVSALLSVGLLGAAARVSLVLAGLSPQLRPAPGLDTKAIRAANWLSSLRAGFSSAAALGVAVTVLTGAPRPCCIAFGALTGALLLLRARSCAGVAAAVLAVCGIVTITTTFGVIALSVPQHAAWTAAATATLTAAAIYLGFVAPVRPLSPLLDRGIEALECAALVAMVPVTCWVCGLYSAFRGLTLT